MPNDRIEYDVILVGGSPSNLALAHRLLDLAKDSGIQFSMALLEKGREFGAHVVSGAVSNPRVIKKLFPNYEETGFPIEAVCNESHFSVLGNKQKWDVPAALVPPGMKKEGYFVLTLSHVVYWMANRLKEKAKDTPNVVVDFFPGFSAHEILYEGNKAVGVQVEEKSTNPLEDNIYGKVIAFGDKGFISRNHIDKFKLRETAQIWSVGVKEVWELAEGKDYTGKVWHTMGFPLVDGTFGGAFIYGMKDRKLTIGMVISLDSPNPNINPQQRLQDLKKHPWVQAMIRGGKLHKYGAALLPEGGYYSLPKKFATDGAILLGDALGVLDISQLSGVDKAMECGYIAAEVIHDALKANDFSEAKLAPYQEKVMNSFVGKELFAGRYFRHAWQENPRLLEKYLPVVMEGIDAGNPVFGGLIPVGFKNNPFTALGDALRLKALLDGKKDIGPVQYKPDYQHIVPNFKPPRQVETNGFVKDTIYSREDAVFYAHTRYHEHNEHIDEFNADVCVKCISTYDALGKDTPCVSDCTAEVHRVDVVNGVRHHGMSLENCVQCRTCEMVCPEVNLRVRPTAQGSGPDFMGL